MFVPRRLRSPCPSHRSRTTQRQQAPCPARSRHSALFWISEFLQLCVTKHPSRRTVPLRIHVDLREAQTTFADAATQFSFAEFLESRSLSSALPPLSNPSPTFLGRASTRLEGATVWGVWFRIDQWSSALGNRPRLRCGALYHRTVTFHGVARKCSETSGSIV